MVSLCSVCSKIVMGSCPNYMQKPLNAQNVTFIYVPMLFISILSKPGCLFVNGMCLNQQDFDMSKSSELRDHMGNS